MKNQKGFTLIELVMVILLLGILAAVAIPRFWDLGTRADQAAGDGGIGGIKSGVAIYQASRLAAGVTPIYPGNPIDGTVVSDLYSTGGAVTTAATCAGVGANQQGQWGVDSTTNANAITYRWRGAARYSSWSYSSVNGIVGAVRSDSATCTGAGW